MRLKGHGLSNRHNNFMHRKKNLPDFNQSEPEFLISCLDRHQDWAVIVCLVGGGQEINTGEAGISEWFSSLIALFRIGTSIYLLDLIDSEYGSQDVWMKYIQIQTQFTKMSLHLAVSMRSFRAENVSLFVKQLLDLTSEAAQKTLLGFQKKYPILLTRNLFTAKEWLKHKPEDPRDMEL